MRVVTGVVEEFRLLPGLIVVSASRKNLNSMALCASPADNHHGRHLAVG